jgi:hypothetical protein
VAGEDQRDKRKRTTDDVSKCIGWGQNWELSALQDESRRDLQTVWVASGIVIASLVYTNPIPFKTNLKFHQKPPKERIMTSPVRLFWVHAVDENYVGVKIPNCKTNFLKAHRGMH